MARRQKISTTVAPESYDYLCRLIRSGEARNVAEAIDRSIARLRRADNRRRLEASTAAYFNSLSEKAQAEERALESSLDSSADEIDFDA